MSGNRFVLSSVAFFVSFGVTLGLSRGDFLQAIGNGGLTFLSSQIGCVVASRQPDDEENDQGTWRVEELRGHIRSLQRRRTAAYEDLTQLTQERDRVMSTLQGLQGQVQQLQSKSNNLWQQKEALSWNLSQPKRTTAELQSSQAQIKNSEAQIHSLEREEADLNRSLATTLSAKQRAEAQLTLTQTELNQLLAQVAEQKVQKTELLNEITTLAEQRHQLTQELTQLDQEIQGLERYRQELGTLIQAAEPAREQVSQGSKSLQTAIGQLQGQISSLHGELETLERQILDRRSQKESLDQELSSLRDQTVNFQPQNSSRNFDASFDPWQAESLATPTVSPTATTDSTAPIELDFSQEPNLDPAWAQFAKLLPKYEVQALTAIARHASPNQRLKQIAEANLTMPELLVDAINERALETIGDILLEPGSQAGTPVIAQEYEASVQAILRAYDRTKKAQNEA